ncbi:hypothetical protein D521_1835 [beta proteobacterium CB]|nr:hypothetical protein D521_1835 [beta proteobacterium CB]
MATGFLPENLYSPVLWEQRVAWRKPLFSKYLILLVKELETSEPGE